MDDKQAKSWLEVLEERVDVDIDWMDPAFIKSLPRKPHDQTSNQLWMGIQLAHASNTELLKTTAKELKGQSWIAVYSKMATLMCKENMDSILGRVLVQTSPSQAYDTEATIEHAKLYDREFQQRGIPRERFCIKIPATGPGVLAMQRLSQGGIPVLGTAVFSVEQAIACSQAGCIYISPYYNEVRSHQDLSLWPNVKDPAVEHPFSHRIYQIIESYKRLYHRTGQDQPLVKLAAFRSRKEVIAAAELGCHSCTVSAQMLKELAETPYEAGIDPGWHHGKPAPKGFYGQLPGPTPRLQPLLTSDPLAQSQGFIQPASLDIDYLADGASDLVKALDGDPAGKNRLNDAISMFIDAEVASKTLIESVTKQSTL